jgi:hypothetical protein
MARYELAPQFYKTCFEMPSIAFCVRENYAYLNAGDNGKKRVGAAEIMRFKEVTKATFYTPMT